MRSHFTDLKEEQSLRSTGVDLQAERYELRGRSLSRLWIGALWGLAEATVFFLVPDILITASALFAPKRSFAQMLAVLIGALLGGALLYTAADQYPNEAKNLVLNVPFIKPHLLDQADRQLQDRGLLAMCVGSFTGVPYKTYAVNAPRRASFEVFMAMSVLARLLRFLVSWGVASVLGIWFRSQIQASPLVTLGLLAICWIGFYTYYWSVI